MKDSLLSLSLVRISASYQVPGGDLAERFGNNAGVGLDYFYKFRSNWLIGVKGQFIFGTNVKEDQLFQQIATDKGFVVSRDGKYTDLRLYERGYEIALQFGKILPFFSPNPNSGLMLSGSAGFLEHKIRIETLGNTTPQLSWSYKKGYDRLSNGLAFSEFIGYQYLGNNRLINMFGGLECTQAFTKNRRSYNFDTMSRDDRKRTDLLYGLRIGLIVPLYKKLPKDYYYY